MIFLFYSESSLTLNKFETNVCILIYPFHQTMLFSLQRNPLRILTSIKYSKACTYVTIITRLISIITILTSLFVTFKTPHSTILTSLSIIITIGVFNPLFCSRREMRLQP